MHLWQQAVQIRQAALNSGALLSLPATSLALTEHGLNWVVRILQTLKLKETPADTNSIRSNPFLPPEPALTVTKIGNSHLCVLNKYNVFDLHLLLVTPTFVPQSQALDLADFSALFACLQQQEALAFYNSGPIAGASQPHKHLQLVALSDSNTLPFAPQLTALNDQVPRQLKNLPFTHAAVALPTELFNMSVSEAGQQLLQLYDRLRMTLGIEVSENAIEKPYNLLLTRQWLMLVPRQRESVMGISFNALAFTGSLLVQDRTQVKQLQDAGLASTLQLISG
ncbi:DUF4922 domain-containing protein [Pontibacter sp. JAM-7]|uniref:DUF4922 domain-containing protein n=1 Tax=Pontibacter sp. JAM-7 TaxID=3366581 RepID=UPI003AF8949B